MIKNAIVLCLTFILLSFSVVSVFAIGENGQCDPKDGQTNHGCDNNLFCKPFSADPSRGSCEINTAAQPPAGGGTSGTTGGANGQTNSFQSIFGKIQPPDPLKGYISQDPTGTGGLQSFFSNLIKLIYSLAGVVLVFMIIWGAFDWVISEGDKEKIKAAQQKIINAIIGIILFAVAFAVISVLGTFTGFRFFSGQGVNSNKLPSGAYTITCPDGVTIISPVNDYAVTCASHGYH